MLEEKRVDLTSEKRKKLLTRLMGDLSHLDANFYYRSTAEIAAAMLSYAEKGTGLNGEERELMKGLTQRDVEVLLSLH